MVFVFFFFKQKTAYEMRISDWSSDVCSSDLDAAPCGVEEGAFDMDAEDAGHPLGDRRVDGSDPALDHRQIVADQRRQQPGGAEAAVRGGDRRDRRDAGVGVEQRTAADRKSTRLNSSH